MNTTVRCNLAISSTDMRLDVMLGFATAGICSGTFQIVIIVACPLFVHEDRVLMDVCV